MTNLNTEIFNKIFMLLPGPQAIWVFGTFVVISMIYRLIAEWQRRVTLDHIFTHAPGGSVIFQEKGLACPAMSIWVGTGLYRAKTPFMGVSWHFEDRVKLLGGTR
jgi:hypothetical protein